MSFDCATPSPAAYISAKFSHASREPSSAALDSIFNEKNANWNAKMLIGLKEVNENQRQQIQKYLVLSYIYIYIYIYILLVVILESFRFIDRKSSCKKNE